MIYRLYNKDDFHNGLSELLLMGYGSTISQNVLEEQYIGDNRNICVAYDEESMRVAGCMFWDIHDDYVRPSRTLYASYLIVDTSYRKQGIATSLFREFEKICLKTNCSSIEFTSANFRKDAHRLYLSIGFTKKDTSVFIKEINRGIS